MPEAILAGPTGQPAIEAETGMPLSMEELLRRRGISVVNGRNALVQPDQVAQVATPVPAEVSISPTVGAIQARSQSIPTGSPLSSASSVAIPPVGTPAQGLAPKSNEAMEAEGATVEDVQGMEALGWLAAGTAAAYGAYLASKNRGATVQGAGPERAGFGVEQGIVPRPGQAAGGNTIDGSELFPQRSTTSKAKTAVAMDEHKRLPAPPKLLEDLREDASGVARTVGRSARTESETSKALKMRKVKRAARKVVR